MNYFFIVALIIFSIIVVREDIAKGKIRNKWIKAGLLVGALGYLLAFLMSMLAFNDLLPQNINAYSLGYFLSVFINLFASVLASYLFWQYKLWSAGDAKFFILLSFLLPLDFYSNGFLPYFPSSALLINIFLPIFAFLSLKMVFETAINFRKFIISEVGFAREHWAKIKLEMLSFWNHKRRALILGGTFLLTFIFIPVLKYQTILMLPSNFLIVFSVFLFFYVLQSYTHEIVALFLKKKWFLPGMTLFVIGYFICGSLYFSNALIFALIMTIKVGTVFLVALTIFERFSDFYLRQKEVMIVNVKDLKSKMVISEEFIQSIQNDKELQSKLGDLYPEGLTEDQVEIIKKWLIAKNKPDVVPVYKTFSFAPYIFMGAIITMVFRQSILHLLLAYIR